jgi:hypothetical protein
MILDTVLLVGIVLLMAAMFLAGALCCFVVFGRNEEGHKKENTEDMDTK